MRALLLSLACCSGPHPAGALDLTARTATEDLSRRLETLEGRLDHMADCLVGMCDVCDDTEGP